MRYWRYGDESCPGCGAELELLTQTDPQPTTHNEFAKDRVLTLAASEHRAVLKCIECGCDWLYERKMSLVTRPTKELREKNTERKRKWRAEHRTKAS